MRQKDYFGLGRAISIVLAIIPVTSWVLGAVTRLQEGKVVAAVLRFILGWNIIWILDIIFMIKDGHIFKLLDV